MCININMQQPLKYVQEIADAVQVQANRAKHVSTIIFTV